MKTNQTIEQLEIIKAKLAQIAKTDPFIANDANLQNQVVLFILRHPYEVHKHLNHFFTLN
jgi:hypothetical protein